MKTVAKWIFWFIFPSLCLLAGAWMGYEYSGTRKIEIKIPSLAEVQEMVGAKPDGIYGPETAEKWDRAICNQYAAKWDFMYEETQK